MQKRLALQMFFDQDSEKNIYGYFEMFRDAGISSYLIDAHSRPHITIGIYYDIDIPRSIAALEAFCAAHSAVPVGMRSIGIFPRPQGGDSALYINPSVTRELLDLHANARAAFSFCDHGTSENYSPGHVIPHCTVDTGDFETICRSTRLLMERFQPFEAVISYIGWADLTRPVSRVAVFPLK